MMFALTPYSRTALLSRHATAVIVPALQKAEESIGKNVQSRLIGSTASLERAAVAPDTPQRFVSFGTAANGGSSIKTNPFSFSSTAFSSSNWLLSSTAFSPSTTLLNSSSSSLGLYAYRPQLAARWTTNPHFNLFSSPHPSLVIKPDVLPKALLNEIVERGWEKKSELQALRKKALLVDIRAASYYKRQLVIQSRQAPVLERIRQAKVSNARFLQKRRGFAMRLPLWQRMTSRRIRHKSKIRKCMATFKAELEKELKYRQRFNRIWEQRDSIVCLIVCKQWCL